MSAWLVCNKRNVKDFVFLKLQSENNTHLLCKGNRPCTADLLFYRFRLRQTRKTIDNFNVSKAAEFKTNGHSNLVLFNFRSFLTIVKYRNRKLQTSAELKLVLSHLKASMMTIRPPPPRPYQRHRIKIKTISKCVERFNRSLAHLGRQVLKALSFLSLQVGRQQVDCRQTVIREAIVPTTTAEAVSHRSPVNNNEKNEAAKCVSPSSFQCQKGHHELYSF